MKVSLILFVMNIKSNKAYYLLIFFGNKHKFSIQEEKPIIFSIRRNPIYFSSFTNLSLLVYC